MTNEVVLGIDLGTSSVKVLALFQNGKFHTHAEPLTLIHPQNGYNEQRPEDWVTQTFKAIRSTLINNKISGNAVKAISFSGQMHGLVALGKDQQVLRNAILWNDTRSAAEVEEIQSGMGQAYIDITGNRAVEGYVLPKLLWLQKHEPMIWNQIDKVLLPKDYLRLRMTGSLGTDYSDATGTGYLDIGSGKWSRAVLEHFGISLDWMPRLMEAGEIVGGLTQAAADASGLLTDTLVAVGGADNAMGAIGAGVVEEDQLMSSIGTSGVMLHPEKKLRLKYNGSLQLERHAIKSRFYSMGVTLAAGNSLSWFRDTFSRGKSFEDIAHDAATSSIGAHGVLFAPYLSGERTPYFDPHVRGGFMGISNDTSFNDFARAVLEGIVFSLNDVLNLYRQFEVLPSEIIAIGGGAKNTFWAQMQADVFDLPLKVPVVDEGPGYGAAIIASVAGNWFSDVDSAINELVKYDVKYTPIAGNRDAYEDVYKEYRQFYRRLA